MLGLILGKQQTDHFTILTYREPRPVKNDLSIISSALIFEGLPDQYLEKIRDVAVPKKYAKGETIFMEQDEGNGFYLVAEGMVKIFKLSPSGKEQILHVFGAGEPF